MRLLRISLVTIAIALSIYGIFVGYMTYVNPNPPKTIDEMRQQYQDCFAKGGKSVSTNPLVGECELNGKTYGWEG